MPVAEQPQIAVYDFTCGNQAPPIRTDSSLVQDCVIEFHDYMKTHPWNGAAIADKVMILNKAIDTVHKFFGAFDLNWKKDETENDIIGDPNGKRFGKLVCRHEAAMVYYLLFNEGIACNLCRGYAPHDGLTTGCNFHAWVEVEDTFLLETTRLDGTKRILNRALQAGLQADQVSKTEIYTSFIASENDDNPLVIQSLYKKLHVSTQRPSDEKFHPSDHSSKKMSYTLTPFGNHLFVRANNIPWQPAVPAEQKARV